MNADRLKILQFVVASLMIGVVAFGAISVVAGGVPQAADIRASSLAIFGIVLTISSAVASFVFARMQNNTVEGLLLDLDTESQREELLSEQLQRRTMIGCALLEGAILLNLILNLLQRNPLFLISAAVLLALMSFYFPTSERAERWLATRREAAMNQKSLK